MKPHWFVTLVTIPTLLHTWLDICPDCCCCCCWWCICCWNCACCCWLLPPPNVFGWLMAGRVFGYCTVWLNILLPANWGISAKLFCAATAAAFWCWAIAKFWLKFGKPTKFGLIICDCRLGMAFCWPAFPNAFLCHGGFDPPPNDMTALLFWFDFNTKISDDFVRLNGLVICTRGRNALRVELLRIAKIFVHLTVRIKWKKKLFYIFLCASNGAWPREN